MTKPRYDASRMSGTLADEPTRYFEVSKHARLLRLAEIRVTTPPEDVIARASQLMESAYRGETRKRLPITVRAELDGTYSIIDGHATTAVARANNWRAIPAIVTAA